MVYLYACTVMYVKMYIKSGSEFLSVIHGIEEPEFSYDGFIDHRACFRGYFSSGSLGNSV